MVVDNRCQDIREGRKCSCPGELSPHHEKMTERYETCRKILADWIAGGVCQSCGTPLVRGWCFDHDHVTGRGRGVLCRRCNCAAGYMEDRDYVALVTGYLDRAAGASDTDAPRRRISGSVYYVASRDRWLASAGYVGADGRRKRRAITALSREEAEAKLVNLKREVAVGRIPRSMSVAVATF